MDKPIFGEIYTEKESFGQSLLAFLLFVGIVGAVVAAWVYLTIPVEAIK